MILLEQLIGQLFDHGGFSGTVTAKDCDERHDNMTDISILKLQQV